MSKFQLSVALHESYLAGGIYEYDPTLSVYGAWTGARYSRTVELSKGEWLELGGFALPEASETNQDDEVLSFTAFAQTRTSGIAPIDEKESKIVQRMIPTGVEKMDLRDLLSAASRSNGDQDLLLTSPMVLVDARSHALAGRNVSDLDEKERDEISRDVTALATKLWLKVRVTISSQVQPVVNAWLRQGRPQLQRRCLYFDERTPARITASLTTLETSYVTHLTEIELPPAARSGGAASAARIPWNPHEPISKDLHFFSGDTPAGPLPPVAWTLQDVQTRIGAAALEGEGAVTAKETAQFLESSLLGSLWAAGMDGATFTRVVTEQCSAARKHDSQLLSSFRTAVGAVLGVATLVANQALYATDMEYPNIHALREMTPEKQSLYAPGLVKSGLVQRLASSISLPREALLRKSRECVWVAGPAARISAAARSPAAATSLKHCHKCGKLHSRKRGYAGAPEPSTKPSYEATVVVTGDRWDTTINSQDTTTCDCEEGGFGITANLDAMEVFLEKFLEKDANARPILSATYAVLQRLTFLANGASSTEPYVAAASRTGAPAAATHVPLPVIGSAEDQKWAENGHGFATVQTKASWAASLLRGLHVLPLKDPREHERLTAKLHRVVDASEPWLAQLRPFVLEGTGPTTMEMLSVEEIYAGTDRADVYVRKTAAKIALLRRIRRLDKDDAVAAAFTDVVKHESLPYEVYAPIDAASRRSHPFYRTIMHCVSPKAVREYGGTLGQVAAINLAGAAAGPSGPGPVRAVTIGDYGRMARNVAFVPVYAADVTSREWHEKIQPAIDCVTNLQQASTWARAPLQFPPKTAQLVTRVAFTQLASNAASLTHVNTALNALPTVHSSLPSDDAAALRLVVEADASDSHVTFQMFLPAWQVVASAPKLQGLMEAVDALKQEGVVAGALIVREQPLWKCAATLRLILVLNVEKDLDSSLWPRPQ